MNCDDSGVFRRFDQRVQLTCRLIEVGQKGLNRFEEEGFMRQESAALGLDLVGLLDQSLVQGPDFAGGCLEKGVGSAHVVCVLLFSD